MDPDQVEFLASITEAVAASGETADGSSEPNAPAGASDLPVDPGVDADGDSNTAAADTDHAEASADSTLDTAAVAELLASGDLEELCRRAGQDPKILKVNAGKIKADREILRQAKTSQHAAELRAKEATGKLAEAKQILDGGRKTYGWAVDLKNMIAGGDLLGIKELCLGLAPKGVTWEQLNAGIVKAEKGDNPSEVMYRSLLRKQAQEKAEADAAAARQQAEQAAKTAEADQARRNLEGATARLKGTQFEKIPGAAEKLVQIVNAAYDPVREGFSITPQQALQQLAKDPLISLALRGLGGKPRAPEPATARRNTKGQFATPSRNAETRLAGKKLSGADERRKAHEAEMAAAIAEASKLEAKEHRSAGGPRR